MSVFFCDSNSELWYTKAEELGLKVIGMPYNIDNDEERAYDLGKNTDFNDFYTRLKKGSSAKTSALNEQNYIDYFEPVLASGNDVLYVHFSRKMSGTFEYMDQAIKILKKKYPKNSVKCVDTQSIAIGEAIIVYEAGKMWKNGASDEEIIDFVIKNRENYAMYFLVDDLKHLKKGGRLSTTSFVVGTMLNIKPILKISSEGTIVKHCVAKGRKKGLNQLFEIFKTLNENAKDYPICIAHAIAEEDAMELKKMIENYISEPLEIWFQPIGPTVGTHGGPGSIGLAFHSKQR
ncbi:MAG: DegV family protein [Clostridia bacterium]|jgi:DegV family protein with EDD domain|nr:DegV family protein [Clostridia bacterium]